MPSIHSLLSTTQLPPSSTVNLPQVEPVRPLPESGQGAIAPRMDTADISLEAQQLLAREQGSTAPHT